MSTFPAGYLEVTGKLRNDIASGKASGEFGQARLAETRARLRLIRKMWRELGDVPMVKQMTLVAEEVLKGYRLDFYHLDLEHVFTRSDQGRFAWYVRPHGSHIIRLEGDKRAIEREKYTLSCFCRAPNNGHDVLDADRTTGGRLYLCDPAAGVIQRLERFSQVPFRVVAGDESSSGERACAV